MAIETVFEALAHRSTFNRVRGHRGFSRPLHHPTEALDNDYPMHTYLFHTPVMTLSSVQPFKPLISTPRGLPIHAKKSLKNMRNRVQGFRNPNRDPNPNLQPPPPLPPQCSRFHASSHMF